MLNFYSEENPQYFDKDIGPNVARCVCGNDCADAEECLVNLIAAGEAVHGPIRLDAVKKQSVVKVTVERRDICAGCDNFTDDCSCEGEDNILPKGVTVHKVASDLKIADGELRDAPGNWDVTMNGSSAKISRDIKRVRVIKDREQNQKRVLFYKLFPADHETYLEYRDRYNFDAFADEIHIGHSNADGCNRNWKYQSGRKHKQWAKLWSGLIRQNDKFGEWASAVDEIEIAADEENRRYEADIESAWYERDAMQMGRDYGYWDALCVDYHKQGVAAIGVQIMCLERTFDNALRMDGVDFLPEVPRVDAISESEEVEDDSVARLDFDYVDSFQIAVEDPNPELTEQHVVRVCKKEIPISSQQRFASEPFVYYVN